jgi:tetratricopeptide (TPR) repeat protein
VLWLLSNAPAGLFAAQFEDDHFGVADGLNAIASLRQWNLIYTTDAYERERLQCLSPIRLFVSQRWAQESPHEAERLKRVLLHSIGTMVGVIEERSGDVDQIEYMVQRISEEMPNILRLIEEAAANPADSELSRLALAVCSSLVRYFFVLRLSREGAGVMAQAAELALASGRPDRAAGFVAQMTGLSRRDISGGMPVARAFIARIEASGPLGSTVQGDLLIAKTMLALDEREPELATQASRAAFECFKVALKQVGERRPGDPETIDEELVEIRTEELHNDLAAALMLHGDAQLALRNYDKASESYRHSLRHERGASVAVNVGQIQHQIGNCESHLGNHLEAAECYFKALTVFYMVGMKEFLSNASGELGYTLIDCDPPLIDRITDEGYAACLEDLTEEIRNALAVPARNPQHAIGIARKIFGTLVVGMFAGKARMGGDWSFQIATGILSPIAADTPEDRFSLMILETPLSVGFLVANIEDSRNANGDSDKDLIRSLLSLSCSIDNWSRSVFRIGDWLVAYLSRCHGVVNLTRERVLEFMINIDDDVDDELDLERCRN